MKRLFQTATVKAEQKPRGGKGILPKLIAAGLRDARFK